MKNLFKKHHSDPSSPHPFRKWGRRLRPYLVCLLVLLTVRFCLLTHLRMPPDSTVQGIPAQSHLIVSLTYYGWRIPGESLWGFHRLGYRIPEKGDAVVFTLPDKNGNNHPIVGICQTLPGETIWIDPVRKMILPARTSPDAQPIIIPGRNQSIEVTPHNIHLLEYLINTFEQGKTTINEKGQLLIEGKHVRRVIMGNDYYWIETHTDNFVLVPHKALVGKVVLHLSPESH